MTGAVGRGGIEVDENSIPLDGYYWRCGAESAWHSIMKSIPFEHNDRFVRIMEKYWNKNLSWKQICLNTERFRDHLKAVSK